MSKSYYDILGLTEGASESEIKRSFRTLAKKYHPDRNPGDTASEKTFKEISEAYDTLSNTKKRAEYDTMLKYGAFAGNGAHPGQGGFAGQGGFDQFFRQGGGRGGFQSFRTGGMDGMNGMEDILSSFFGGGSMGGNPFGQQQGRSCNRRAPQKGRNSRASISISFMEMVHGTNRILVLKPSGKKIKVNVPRTIEDGGKIRLAGLGEPGRMGGKNGDLIITVKVMSDQQFERKGNNVHTSVKVPFTRAILGGKVNVKTLTKTVALTLKPGTQPGTIMRMKGMGLDVNGSVGDVFVRIDVELPTTITDEQRKVLEDWEG